MTSNGIPADSLNMKTYYRRRNGRFDRDRRFTKYFFALAIIGFVSMVGINTIKSWVENSKEILIVGNAKAMTWQEEVNMILLNSGIDVELARKIIQHESWWQPDNTHINKDGTRDRGLWMFHEKFHAEVSDACAYDPICSTKEAVRVWKERGPQEWVAYWYVK